MNAANNLVLAPRGTTVVNHDNKAINEQATKQDLHNQGIQIDSEFVKVDSQFTNLRTDMNAGFSNLRTDMDAKFDKANDALNKTFFKFGSLCFTMMFAVLSIDRWWR